LRNRVATRGMDFGHEDRSPLGKWSQGEIWDRGGQIDEFRRGVTPVKVFSVGTNRGKCCKAKRLTA